MSILNTLSAASAAADSSWVETFSSGMENLNPNAPFSEKLLYGLKIALIGIVVVFLILAIIWAVLFVFNLIFKNKSAAKPAERETAPAPVQKRVSGTLDEETAVAVATAAIAAARGEEKCAFNVISITKIQK
ncbi:MAG: OadG family protein [Candidatus Woodwardiibium sp.]